MKPTEFKEPHDYTEKSPVKSPNPKPTKERLAEIKKDGEKELEKPLEVDNPHHVGWAQLQFRVTNGNAANLIHDAADLLHQAGIMFDTGHSISKDSREQVIYWELDWSVTGPLTVEIRDAVEQRVEGKEDAG